MKYGIVLGLLLVVLLVVPVAAQTYIASITVTEDDTEGYDMLPLAATIDNQNLIDLNIMSSTGLGTRVLQGPTELPHLVVDDRLLFALPVIQGYQYPLEYTFGNTALSGFPVIVGDGGYVTYGDHASLEMGGDFGIEFEGWIDTSYEAAYPIVESTDTSIVPTQETSHTVDLPSGIESGDLLLMLFGAQAEVVITWPGGWTELDQHQNGDVTEGAGGAAYRVATGSEGSTATVTTNAITDSAHHTFRITDYTGVPEISTVAYGTSSSPNPSSLTPSWGTSLTLWFTFFGGDHASPASVSSYPSSYGDGQATLSRDGYAWIASARRELASSSENPGSFTLSAVADGWHVWTISVQGQRRPLVSKGDSFILENTAEDELTATLNCEYYYYNESLYEGDWEVGFSLSTGSQSKESSHLYLYAYSTSYAERTYVTSSTIDFTNIDTICIDWENTGSASNYNNSYLVVDGDQGNNYADYEARAHLQQDFVRTLTSLDVSGVTGSKYIRVHAYDSYWDDGGFETELLVYGVYSEHDIDLETTDITEGKYKVELWADGSTVNLDIDDVNKDSESFTRYTVADNSHAWVISLPYFNYYKHTVSDTLYVHYEPITMIDGTTLPDREGAVWDGTITWGSNPSNIEVSVGALLPTESSVASATAEGSQASFMPETGDTTWTSSGIEGENLPLYGFFAGLLATYREQGGADIPMPLFWKIVVMIAAWGLGTAVLLATRQVVFGLIAYIAGFAVPAFYMGGLLDSWIPIVYGIGAVCLAGLIWKWTSSAIA